MKIKPGIALALALALLLSGCGGGGSAPGGSDGSGDDDGTGNPPGPSTGIQGATCSESASGATGFVTCHELERLGGLALTALRISSLGFSMGYDRAAARIGEDASACPAGGTVGTNLIAGNAIESVLASCDFGVGPMTGTVVTLEPSVGSGTRNTDWQADVSVEGVRYEGTGTTDTLSDSIPQVSLAGEITVGDSTPLRMDMQSVPITEDDGSVTYSVGAQHFGGFTGGNSIRFQTTSPDFDKTTLSEQGDGFVVVELPFAQTFIYLRAFSNPEALRVESAEATFTIDGRALEATLINTSTGQGQAVATTWDAAMAAPRYDFAD